MSARQPPSAEQIAEVFRELSERRADEMSRLAAPQDWRRLQSKWQDRIRERSSRRWSARIVVGFSVAAAAASLLIGIWTWPHEQGLSFVLRQGDSNGPELSAQDGEWIHTTNGAAALDFSDGSELQIEPHTDVNVDVRGKHSARARLASGRLRASVHHADETDWVFVAGPYEVRVIGTAFELAWQDSALSLVMLEGQVEVLGPERQHWTLRKGEALEIPAPEDNSAPQNDSAAEGETQRDDALPADGLPQDATAAKPDTQPNAATARVNAGESSDRKSKTSDPARGAWQGMLGKGKFEGIVSQARARGLDSVMATTSAVELAALAQAAGYTGELSIADQAWKTIRSRSAGSSGAQRAAFFLARLSERRGSNAEALKWLDTYLREAPSGILAMEAYGRKLVLTRRIHGSTSAKARSVANTYLSRYPEGSYAETARATLAQR